MNTASRDRALKNSWTRKPSEVWRSARDSIDLASVAVELLGPPHGRRGDRSARLWWRCPLGTHPDSNPSFCIAPGKASWRCFGCGEHGDGASLVMRLKAVTFGEAVRILTGSGRPLKPHKPHAPSPSRPPDDPAPTEPSKSFSAEVAETIAAEAVETLWGSRGAPALGYLAGAERCLRPETIREAGLGFVPADRKIGGVYFPGGIVIPWRRSNGSLAALKVRRFFREGGPKYLTPYQDKARPLGPFPGDVRVKPGRPLILTEGEFDSLLLSQELAGRALTILTLGGACVRPTKTVLLTMLSARPWFVGLDADEAGRRADSTWTGDRVRVVKPPGEFKDWTDAYSAGVDIVGLWLARFRAEGCDSPVDRLRPLRQPRGHIDDRGIWSDADPFFGDLQGE